MSNADLIATLTRTEFSPEFTEWLATAPMEDIEGAYAENYKDAHGIKARWVYNAGITRDEFANMFVILGHDIQAEEKRQNEADEAFRKRIADLGLTEWAQRNGIHNEYDLMDYNYRTEVRY